MSNKRVIVTSGGTGGHLYPAQGFAQQMTKTLPGVQVLFSAGGLNTSKYFDRSQFRYREVACRPILLKNPIKVLKGFFSLFQGFFQSVKVIKDFKPDVVVGFGSYYTLPTVLAALWMRVPVILHEANSIPGKANKWLAPYVHSIGTLFPSTSNHLKGNVVEVGMPLRKGFTMDFNSREASFRHFSLASNLPTLLVFGGSQGARSINTLMMEGALRLKNTELQILHFTGDAKIVEDISKTYDKCGIKSCVKPFENQMEMAWKIADAFISRSGASTIAEAIEFETPGILIPYPFATDKHQDKNAEFFVDAIGGGVKLDEVDLSASTLINTLTTLLQEKNKSKMKSCIKKYKNRPNRLDLCQHVINTLQGNK